MASKSKKKFSEIPASTVFKAVKEAYDRNLGLEYYDEDNFSDTDFIISECEQNRKYLVFTKYFCLRLICELVIDNDENETGIWHKEYGKYDSSRSYGKDTAKMEDMIKFVNDRIFKL